MQILDLPVQTRDKVGSANSRRYRRAGMIPCVLYGRGLDNINLVAERKSFDSVLKAHTALVRLQLEDKSQTALVREVDWDVFGEFVRHIDFTRVEMEDEVKLKVPVHHVGIPEGASHGGVTEVLKREVEVYSRVDSIPSEIRIDISALDIGDSIYVEDLSYPEHVRYAGVAKDLVLHVVEPKKVEEPVEGEEGELPAEDAAPPAEGAPAEGGED